MDQDVSITLTGSAERISAVLDFWKGGERAPEAGREQPVSGPDALAELDFAPFVRGLSAPASAVVYRIASDAARGLRVPVDELVKTGEISSPAELNGFMGGVGRVWGRLFNEPNPFIRSFYSATDESYYELDLEFARKLVAVFDERGRHFGRWTAGARESLALAHAEAEALSHGAIGTEHLLLGLLSEGEGLAAKVLVTTGVTLELAREKVEVLSPHQGPPTSGELTLTSHLRRLLSEDSIAHARAMKDTHIGTEHLLLGLLDARDSTVAEVLSALNPEALADPRHLRAIVERYLADPGASLWPVMAPSPSEIDSELPAFLRPHVSDVPPPGDSSIPPGVGDNIEHGKPGATDAEIEEAAKAAEAREFISRLAAKVIAELSPREHEVLDLIARGQAAADIANALSISIHTVNAHQGHIYKKLGVSNRADAVDIAHRAGLGG